MTELTHDKHNRGYEYINTIADIKADHRNLFFRLNCIDKNLEKQQQSLESQMATTLGLSQNMHTMSRDVEYLKSSNGDIKHEMYQFGESLKSINRIVEILEPFAEYAKSLRLICRILLFLLGIALILVAPEYLQYLKALVSL